MRKLIITTPAGPVAHELTDDLVTLGRSPENMIHLDDPSVSGRHAQLQLAGEEYELSDLGSTNGTQVNGSAITAAKVLRPSDRVRFGKVEACLECDIPGKAQPLPELQEVQAKLADVSARPADFANASPFPKRRVEKDPARTALFAAAGLAILAFLASMATLAQMKAPLP